MTVLYFYSQFKKWQASYLEIGEIFDRRWHPGQPGVYQMKLLQRILKAVKGVVADVLDGGVPDVKHPHSLVFKYLPIKFLHVALGYVKLFDERPYLQRLDIWNYIMVPDWLGGIKSSWGILENSQHR